MFKDHFSHDSKSYSQNRPGYPDSLFYYISSLCEHHQLALDCATGSGQSASKLSHYFDHVLAADGSFAQLAHASCAKNISYIQAIAENIPLKNESLDLISVAQAAHWFNLPDFKFEVDRLLKPSGIFVIWGYNLLSTTPAIDKLIQYFYHSILHDCWPTERAILEQCYSSIQLPYSEILPDTFSMSRSWTLPQLKRYLSTWSAVKIYTDKYHSDPLALISGELEALWGMPDKKFKVEWPLVIKVWRK